MDQPSKTYNAIILAAGASKRMEGLSKQSLMINGQALLNRVIQTVTATSVSQTCVVLGAQYQFHKNLIQHFDAIDIVENKNWENGIGSSIKCGMSWLSHHQPASSGTFVLVCDQPYLSSGLLDSMIKTFERKDCKIVACEYEGSIGTPVFFDHSFFEVLQNINDEQGAKQILKQYSDHVLTLPFPEGTIDVDTREDYEKLVNDGI